MFGSLWIESFFLLASDCLVRKWKWTDWRVLPCTAKKVFILLPNLVFCQLWKNWHFSAHSFYWFTRISVCLLLLLLLLLIFVSQLFSLRQLTIYQDPPENEKKIFVSLRIFCFQEEYETSSNVVLKTFLFRFQIKNKIKTRQLQFNIIAKETGFRHSCMIVAK